MTRRSLTAPARRYVHGLHATGRSGAEPQAISLVCSLWVRAEPLYVLNPRQRLLYVNAAWEALTGFTLEDVRGQAFRRRRTESASERQEVLLAALAPPAAVKQGRLVEVRRRMPTAAGPIWVMVQFFAIFDDQGEARILGKIRPITVAEPVLHNPLPEKLLALHDQTARAYALERLPTQTPELGRLHDQIRLAAQTRTPVSIVGPSGAGKHWLARCLHHETLVWDGSSHASTVRACRQTP